MKSGDDRKPQLRVVSSQPAAGTDPFADIEALRRQNLAAFAALGTPLRRSKQRPGQSLPRLWAPAYLDELVTLGLPSVARLLYVLRCRSYSGQKALVLDAALAVEAGIDPRNRSRYARRLEKLGFVDVESVGQQMLQVRVR
jgi:hypothetical protein